MDYRDVIVAVSVAVGIPLCFRWPWIGGVVWGWFCFLYPDRVMIGLVHGTPFIALVVIATLAGLAFTSPLYQLPRSREMYLLVAFWAFCALTTAAALYPERAWPQFFRLSRIILLIMVVMAFSQSPRRLTALMWATALAVACYAVPGALWVAVTGGHAGPLYGPRASDIENNNDFAAAMIATLPFFVFLGPTAPRPWMRHAALGVFGITVVAILGTYSRAAVLALVAVLLLLAALRQWRALAVAAVAWVAFLSVTAPQKWVRRVDTIRTFSREASAAQRPQEWYVALRLGLDHPVLGAGFQPFTPETYLRYVGYEDYHNAHNFFLQVFAEHGIPGLALYTALVVSTLATLWRMGRRPAIAPTAARFRAFSLALLVGLVGYIVDAQFHVLSYRPIFFNLLALAIMVDTLARAPAHVIQPIHSAAAEARQRWLRTVVQNFSQRGVRS